MDTSQEKFNLRRHFMGIVGSLSGSVRDSESRIISAIICSSLVEYTKAGRVILYYPLPSEFNASLIAVDAIERGKWLYYPWCRSDGSLSVCRVNNIDTDFNKGSFGILEPREELRMQPIDPRETDMVVIPGLAYDGEGNRLGKGKGYYDRFLSGIKGVVPIVAPAFSCQFTNSAIPSLPHDIKPDIIVTTDGIKRI